MCRAKIILKHSIYRSPNKMKAICQLINKHFKVYNFINLALFFAKQFLSLADKLYSYPVH